jgi:excisionase family DNA binding protein|tara:strand:- start:1342 stop:1569 length:228 start_codon:yes stop_codon:yes gene_type:complete
MEVRYVPIEGVAKYFSISVSTVRSWMRKGEIPANTYIKVGSTYRFNLDALDAALTNPAHVPEDVDLGWADPSEDV